MAVRLDKSIFIHVGRTGGYWVRDVLHEAGLYRDDIVHFHAMPHEVMQQKLNDRPMFAFLRHPFAWLASAWIHHINFSWGEADIRLRSDTFEGFLQNIIKYHPDYLRSIYEPILDYCDEIGRTESLKDDLARIIKKYEGADINKLVSRLPPNNKSSDFLFSGPAIACHDTLEKIYKDNKAIFERTGYEPTYEKYNLDETKDSEIAKRLLTSTYSGEYKILSSDDIVALNSNERKFIDEKQAVRDTILPGNYVLLSKRPIMSYFLNTIYYSVSKYLSDLTAVNSLVIGDNDNAVTSYLVNQGVGSVDSLKFGKVANTDWIEAQYFKDKVRSATLTPGSLQSLKNGEYGLIIINESIDRITYAQEIFNVINLKASEKAVLILHCECADVYHDVPVMLSLYGDFNPFNKSFVNIPNSAWFNHSLDFNGFIHIEDTTYIRIKLNLREGCKYTELNVPNQYVKELERNSAIAKRTAVYRRKE